MDNRPIGVFDSGVGGLTTVKELHRILPGEDIIYFGDTGRVPYGTRSGETIRKYAVQDILFLDSLGVKAIVAACGTVSSNISASEVAALGVAVPYIGVVPPACRAACEQSESGRIGVIATGATIASGAYEAEIHTLRPDADVFGGACPLLVPLVENGLTDRHNPITRHALEMYLRPLREEQIDTLILGCTHYPLLYDIIDEVLRHRVKLVDAGAAAASALRAQLAKQDLLAGREQGNTTYYMTDTVKHFTQVAKNFLDKDIERDCRYIPIERLEGRPE
jgi:glutamate racemase